MENRVQLAEYFAKKNFNYGAEIGVADGRFSEILLTSNPKLQLLSVDPYEPYDGNWRSQNDQDRAFEQAKERLSKYPGSIIDRNTSFEASRHVENGYLDFVFIDGAHDFNNVMLDIILWTPKVRSGGIVAGHDYYDARTVKVIPAIDAYCEQNNIKLEVIPQAKNVHHDDRVPCWWFVKK